jgi:L-ascorbate metabolism protein UlaG (beta-lactamase superfamily)
MRITWYGHSAFRLDFGKHAVGDTDIFSDMALISEIHAPKIAMVPIGDRFTMSRSRSGASSSSTP